MRLKRGAAIILCVLSVAGIFGGCGKAGSGASNPAEQEKGRYVETKVDLPEELEDWNVRQMFSAGGELHLLAAREENGKTVLGEWSRQGDRFEDVTQEWLREMELPGEGVSDLRLMQDGNGTQYLYAGYADEGEEDSRGHLWRGQDAGAREITPEKWGVRNEEWGIYEYISGIAALNDGTLIAVSYTSADTLSGEDGHITDSRELSTWYENIMDDGENAYLCASGDSGIEIEKWRGGKAGDSEDLLFPTADAGGFSLCVLEDGALVAAGGEGIYRCEAGSASWEKLMNGMETDFAVSDRWCIGLCALEDGSIYGLFRMSQGGVTLNKYEYDPEAVTQIREELKVYTVYDSSLLQQAAVLYHREHPDILITIQSAYPRYYYGETDYNAVYQELNTMLMGDEAPDILVMDHLNLESFSQKGLLADIDDIVRPLEESGQLLSNITGAYAGESGSRYVVPLQFGITMAVGRDIRAEEMASLEALADFLSKAKESYMGDQTVGELVDKFYPYFCGEIVSDGQLDREKLGINLEYLKAVADNSGITGARETGERCCNIWDMAGQAKLTFTEAQGFKDCMLPIAVRDYVKGDFTAFENAFLPISQTGICAKSRYVDTAKDFLKFALSETIQDTDYYNGFPVNAVSLEKQSHMDRGDAEAYTTIEAEGGEVEFSILDYSHETAEEILALCRALDKPYEEDEKIREVLTECLEGYLNGAQSREETIQKIEGGLKMYLAE